MNTGKFNAVITLQWTARVAAFELHFEQYNIDFYEVKVVD